MTIDDLSEQSGVTVRNIRAYQSKGLLAKPKLVGRVGKYTQDHLDRLRLIQRLGAAGFNLRSMHWVIAAMPILRSCESDQARELLTVTEP